MDTNEKNLNIVVNEDHAVLLVNPMIFPLSVVYSAAYVMLDKAYIFLDGDPNKEIKVYIKSKNPKDNHKSLAQSFNEELINFAVYHTQSEKNKELRRSLIQRALLTNDFIPNDKVKSEIVDKDKEKAVPWEEKFKDQNES